MKKKTLDKIGETLLLILFALMLLVSLFAIFIGEGDKGLIDFM